MSISTARVSLVTGASGFIGSRVVTALEHIGVEPRRLSRAPSESREVVGDLVDPEQLAAAVVDVHTIIHCATYTGPDAVEQQRVNVEGTRNLITVARASGVQRLISVGTSGVYGGVLGVGRTEGTIPVRPGSSSAHSRAAADALVLRAGGTVVRPNLVVGQGDRMTIPRLLAEMVRLDAWIGDPESLVSVIDAETLGCLIAALVSVPDPPPLLHAAYPRPVRIRDLLEPIFVRAGVRLPDRSLSFEEAVRAAGTDGLSSRQISMVATDNWFNCDRIWSLTGLTSAHVNPMAADTLMYYAAWLNSSAIVAPSTSNP